MFECRFCKRQFTTNSGCGGHQVRCESNPNKKPKRIGWNKGLTYEIDPRVKRRPELHGKKFGASLTGHTRETKEKISAIRKRYLEENPDKVPYVLNHSSKISYPEQYFIDCFSGLNYGFQHPVFRYKLDFVNLQEKLYLEIDGEQHYVDSKMLIHDAKRTEKLIELGWTGIRIRWSEFQKLSTEQKKNKVEEIISSMKWVYNSMAE